MAKNGSLPRPNGHTIHDQFLSLALFVLFLLSWIGRLVFQYWHRVDEARLHGETPESAVGADFLHSFVASPFENRQSGSLQLLTSVVPATHLIHRGSPQGRDADDEMAEDIKATRKKLDA